MGADRSLKPIPHPTSPLKGEGHPSSSLPPLQGEGWGGDGCLWTNPCDARTWTRDYDAMMRDYYRQRAPDYEATYDRPERQADLAALRARLATCFAGRRMLDVACGTGYWSACFAPAAAEVVGVDANDAALEIASAKNLRTTQAPVHFCVGDAYALLADLGTFEAAFVGFFWSHVPHVELAHFIASLHARLAPGARVVMLDNTYVEGSSTPIEFTDADGNAWQQRPLADGSVHHVLKNFPERAEMLAALLPHATATHWWRLDHYWWFEYRLR